MSHALQTERSVSTERSIGELVAHTKGDLTDVVRSTVELGRTEVGRDVKIGVRAAVLFAGAAFLGVFGFLFVLLTLAWVLAIWLPVWAGFGIVMALLLIVTAVLGLLGKKAIGTLHGKPVATIDHVQRSIAVLKGAFATPDDASAPATTGATATTAR